MEHLLGACGIPSTPSLSAAPPTAPYTSLPVASCLHLKQIHSACTIWFTSHSPFVHCPFASVPRPFFPATVPSARAAPTLYSVCSYTLRSLPGAPSSECSHEDPCHTCQLSASRHLHFLASPVRNLLSVYTVVSAPPKAIGTGASLSVLGKETLGTQTG